MTSVTSTINIGCTNTFMYSFVPRSVRVCNSLPEQIVTAPMRPFKNSVTQYLDL